MFKAAQHLGNIAGHGKVNSVVDVVPLEGDAAVEGSFPISGDGVLIGEDFVEVFSMFAANILDTKVIDNEAESNGSSLVDEEAGSVFGLDVAMLGEVWDELVVGKSSGLWEAIHALANFHIDEVVVDKGLQVVLEHDGSWDLAHMNLHVFIAGHGCIQVEVFDIHGHEFGIGSGDDTVEKDFGSGECSSFGRDFTWVVNAVPTDSVADTAGLGFLGSIGADNTEVSGSSAGGDICVFDPEHGVSAFNVFVTLTEATIFFTAGFFP